jgi:hypothetical protein
MNEIPERLYSIYVFDLGNCYHAILVDRRGHTLVDYEVEGEDLTDVIERLSDKLAEEGEPEDA